MTPMMATNGLTGSKKIVIFAVLLVLATLPQSSYEFAFKFGGGGDDENDVTDGTGGKKTPMRRQLDKKFKFHKIERIYADDEETDDGTDADDDDLNNADAIAAKSAEPEEEAEIQFERVRKAKKPRKADERRKSRDSGEEATFFDSLFGIFSFGKQKEEAAEKAEASNSNGIIDWILWLGEKSGRMRPETPPKSAQNDEENWLSYLNRWPFNTLFPFGKPEKSIKMPRHAGDSEKSRRSTRRQANDNDDDDEEPMSEANFESLLHSLPGFVMNAKHISADLECRQQLQVFHRQLRAKKLWTLQMLDATGKITSGLLRGNINQFGDFDLCTQVKAIIKVTPETPMRIRGKYCLAHIEVATDVPELKAPIHLTQGRGLVNGHIGNPSHFLARYSIANWGVCIPSVCPASIVQEMLEMNLSPYNRTGIEFNVEASDNDCAVRPVKYVTKILKKDQKFAGTVFLIFIHMALVAAALMVDYGHLFQDLLQRIRQFQKERKQRNQTVEENSAEITEQETEIPAAAEPSADNEKSNESTEAEEEKVIPEETAEVKNKGFMRIQQLLLDILMSYSPKRTLLELFSQERLDLEFPIFHLMKLAATLMLYVCLKFMMIGHIPVSNRDKLVRFFDQPWSVFFRTPFFYADILLLMSGFLTAYQLSEEMAEKRYIQLLKRFTTKVTRYLPTMFLVLAFQTWILPHLGTGPLWGNIVGQHAQICEQQMWRNGFSVQNAIDFEDTCSPMTVQIALHIQLYLLGPLIVWLYYTDADAVFFVYGALHALSVAARYSRTNQEHLSMIMFHGIHVSKFYRSANLLYSSPVARATPYLLGIGAGLLYRTEKGSLRMLDNLIPVGWALSISSLIWCFWSPSSGMATEFVYSASEAAAYAAWSPLISGLALCWLIFMLPRSENSMLKFLCSTRAILFLSRISYPIQLATYIVVLQNTASVRETVKFHVTDLFNFNEIGAILFYAIIIAFIMDIPAQQIRYMLVNRLFAERPVAEEPESDAELSEQKETENAKNDTAEPVESVWSSDPEEEERNYLERRRSSLAEQAVEEVAKKADEKITKQHTNESEEEEVEEDEEEEEADIAEEAEVKKRP